MIDKTRVDEIANQFEDMGFACEQKVRENLPEGTEIYTMACKTDKLTDFEVREPREYRRAFRIHVIHKREHILDFDDRKTVICGLDNCNLSYSNVDEFFEWKIPSGKMFSVEYDLLEELKMSAEISSNSKTPKDDISIDFDKVSIEL